MCIKIILTDSCFINSILVYFTVNIFIYLRAFFFRWKRVNWESFLPFKKWRTKKSSVLIAWIFFYKIQIRIVEYSVRRRFSLCGWGTQRAGEIFQINNKSECLLGAIYCRWVSQWDNNMQSLLLWTVTAATTIMVLIDIDIHRRLHIWFYASFLNRITYQVCISFECKRKKSCSSFIFGIVPFHLVIKF